MKLKNLADQVMVITGASSGIGLVTARMAAKKGVRLVLAARSEDALNQLVQEIEQEGGKAVAVVADVSNPEDVARIADAARSNYGGFDTWVNNAGVGQYGKAADMPLEDMRRLFDINFWGLVYGSLEALKTLKERGGALINVGSIVSEQPVILQGVYSASKHAVKGFTEAIRMELKLEDSPVSVTLIKPAAIDTPFPLNAKNYLPFEPQHAPPAYAPELVADAILHCAEIPTRELTVGGAGKMLTAMGTLSPALTDNIMAKQFAKMMQSDRPDHDRARNGLDGPSGQLKERGNYPGSTRETSLYTTAASRPLATAAVVAIAAGGVAWWLRARKSNGVESAY